MQTYSMQLARLDALLEKVRDVRALVLGDVCLDVYWVADMRRSTLSRETPHHNMPVVSETYALGGAGNVVKNMCALGADVLPLTMLGADWRGDVVRELLRERGLGADGLVATRDRVTPAYVKPIREGYGGVRYEDARIDFENQTPSDAVSENLLIETLEREAARVDVIAVSDQLSMGVVTQRVRETLSKLARAGKIVIVDSRERIALFPHCIIKPNELESARAVGMTPETVTPDAYRPVAEALQARSEAPVVITLGAAGAICLAPGEEALHAPGIPVPPPIDIVGAGDSFLSAFALALGAGASLAEGVALGNLASSVTIRKLGETGTASAQEVRNQFVTQGRT